MTVLEVREKAASLVEQHAARLGMDELGAQLLVTAIRAIPIDGEDPAGQQKGERDGRR